MFKALILFFLIGLTLVAILLKKTYNRIPAKELKRRARAGDEIAKQLHSVAAYGMSLSILLWLIIGLSAAGVLIGLSETLPVGVAFLGSLILVWLGFAWLPVTKVSSLSLFITRQVTPLVAWALHYAHPVLVQFSKFLRVHANITVHTGLYDKDDLVELIDTQSKQPDNRIGEEELHIAANALRFGEKIVRDIMVPRRAVKTVKTDDVLGPVLMNELHDSGHSRFPVTEGKSDKIVGMLYLRDLVNAKAGGKVENLMDKKVYYVHEEQPLPDALQAFLKVRHHLFLVANSFEEVVGIVSTEDILEQILGTRIIDEFDQYEDIRAVAKLQAEKEHQQHTDKVLE